MFAAIDIKRVRHECIIVCSVSDGLEPDVQAIKSPGKLQLLS